MLYTPWADGCPFTGGHLPVSTHHHIFIFYSPAQLLIVIFCMDKRAHAMHGVGMIAFFFRWWAIHLNDLRGMGASWLVIRGGVVERLAVTGESCEIEKATYLFVGR